jgi:OOP family OmpA-OmpF porin
VRGLRYHRAVRFGVIAVLAAVSGVAAADPGSHVELSAFFGVDRLSDRISLGESAQPEQRPQTAPEVGGRLTLLGIATDHLAVGLEGQLAMTTSWTGYGFAASRPSYFAPVIGYRGNAILRFGWPQLSLHVVGGVGGATVATASPYLQDDTDLVFFWGPGADVKVSPRWRMRADALQTFIPAMGGGTVATYELAIGVVAAFGEAARAPRIQVIDEPAEHISVPVKQDDQPEIEYDSDGDGIPDKADKCPNAAGDGSDGCPTDPDGDGIRGAKDKCPNQPEDFDHFQDEDGCPDPDNDNDGIPDTKDQCPNQPETKNGFEDADGCPDEVPAGLTAALGSAAKVRFEAGKSRLSDAAKAALEPALGLLRSHPAMRVRISGHADNAELAKKRADAVKWYLVDQGIAADQVDTAAGTGDGSSVEMMLAK